jgi:hypothetical protein
LRTGSAAGVPTRLGPVSKRQVPAARPVAQGPGPQRLLAVMAFAVIGLSAIAVVVLLVLPLVGVPSGAFSSGPLAVLRILPLPGLSIGLLLVIALIVVNALGRSRSQRR